jgi:hypothetical protein
MRILNSRTGGVVLGVLAAVAAVGIVLAIVSQYFYFVFLLAIILATVIVAGVWRANTLSAARARDWLQRRDPTSIVFVSARPPQTSRGLERYSTTGSPVRLPAYFPVVVDAAGVGYFSTARSPVPLASIPWSSIGDVRLTDAWHGDDGWLDVKVPILCLAVDDGRDVVFLVRTLGVEGWQFDVEEQERLLREIEGEHARFR